MQTTTHPCSPLIIVNGPEAARLGMNATGNALGQRTRANAAIGRAVRLAVVRERRDAEMSIVKVGLGFVLLAAVMLGGCAGLSSSTPFNPAQSCQASGGSYNPSNGTCRAGNA